MKKYKVILADCPWSYNDKGSKHHPGASHKYECMSLEDLQKLPVAEVLAHEGDCVLFMWTTMPMLPSALDTIKAWGFEYKTVAFTWVKRNKKADSWFWGMGNWTRANAELCLMAIRGCPHRIAANVHSVIDARVQGHSVKPDEVYERIERLCGDVPRVELFARRKRTGWTSIGLAIDGKRIGAVLKE